MFICVKPGGTSGWVVVLDGHPLQASEAHHHVAFSWVGEPGVAYATTVHAQSTMGPSAAGTAQDSTSARGPCLLLSPCATHRVQSLSTGEVGPDVRRCPGPLLCRRLRL